MKRINTHTDHVPMEEFIWSVYLVLVVDLIFWDQIHIQMVKIFLSVQLICLFIIVK